MQSGITLTLLSFTSGQSHPVYPSQLTSEQDAQPRTRNRRNTLTRSRKTRCGKRWASWPGVCLPETPNPPLSRSPCLRLQRDPCLRPNSSSKKEEELQAKAFNAWYIPTLTLDANFARDFLLALPEQCAAWYGLWRFAAFLGHRRQFLL